MEEVFPILAGVVVGLATVRVRPLWLNIALVGALGLTFGTMASWVSGELASSWIYPLIDTAQVIAASVMTAFLVKVWRLRVRSLAR